MTLSFSTKWPQSMGDLAGQPNYFTNKIMKSMWENYPHETKAFILNRSSDERTRFDEISPFEDISVYDQERLHPKLHTIREDKHNRWKPGVKIHPVINNRTKDRFQFAPTLVCTGVQEIHIQHYPGQILTYVDRQLFGDVFHHGLDDIYEYTNDLETLAINDGFPSVEAFFRWFNKDFGGKIIHWTDLKY